MSQENQALNPAPVENLPVKRKRGRPRKNENVAREVKESVSDSVPDVVKRNRRRRDRKASSVDPMVGQVVTGVLDGSFDAGYLLTVRVGDTNRILKGIVFEPRFSVPVSDANDIAPQVKMVKRIHVSLDKPTPPNDYATNQYKQRSRSSGNLPPRNEVSVPTKQLPQIASQVSNGVLNNVNRVSQMVIDVPPKAETVLPSETSKTEAVTTQIVAELSHMLQDNEAAKTSGAQLETQTMVSTEQIPRVDGISFMNGRSSELQKDAESEPKMNEPVQKLETGGTAPEQFLFPKTESESQMFNAAVSSNTKDLFEGEEGVHPVQSHADLFSDTDSIG
ncbi:hypothetical protein C5167_039265 [Papaver somniferum]|uniref:AT hook motif-containing protein n=1 Tax=Papaver somniferum TaxID=3469 RepID=A0A4Y7IBN1_PAPSO|nr:uncharacterized protein LOC113304909 [Papaver somniferum]RZC46323.1 hypothetical protein C5167_039265 [Papaver somniferum]